jgi:TatD DNase family protein
MSCVGDPHHGAADIGATSPGGFDALTHLAPESIDDAARAAILEVARRAGVTGWLLAGADPAGWGAAARAAAATGGYLALGLHPWWAARLDTAGRATALADLFRRDPPAIGEIGLDAVRAPTDGARAAQREALRVQLAWARDRDRPVVFHAVRAIPELLDLIRQDGLPRAGGYIHGWSGDPALAVRAVRLGLHLSFGPRVADLRARALREAARAVPAERLLLESSGPSRAAPRGPADLPGIAAAVAAIRAEDPALVLTRAGAAARAILDRSGGAPPQPPG